MRALHSWQRTKSGDQNAVSRRQLLLRSHRADTVQSHSDSQHGCVDVQIHDEPLQISPRRAVSGSSYVYTNSNLDFYLDDNNGRGVNTIIYDPSGANKFAGFWVLSENAYPRDCIADLYQQLSPYYQKSAGGKRYYALRHNGHSYGIDVSPTQNYKSTVVHIYKFNK